MPELLIKFSFFFLNYTYITNIGYNIPVFSSILRYNFRKCIHFVIYLVTLYQFVLIIQRQRTKEGFLPFLCQTVDVPCFHNYQSTHAKHVNTKWRIMYLILVKTGENNLKYCIREKRTLSSIIRKMASVTAIPRA